MRIEDWRKRIDETDSELLQLLSRRAQLAIQIAKLKTEAGLPLNDPERERVVFSRASRANPGPLDDEAVLELFRTIIRECRRTALEAVRVTTVGAEEEAP